MPPEPDEVGYRMLRSIRRIIRRVSSHSRLMSRQAGLTVPQLLVLRAIERIEAEEVTVAAVADTVQLSRSTVSGVVERLVRAGLIDRVRSERDRRRVHLTVTPRGRAALDQTPKPLQDGFLGRLDALEPDEREALLAALERIVTLMDAEGLDAAPILVSGIDMLTDSDG